MTRWLDLRGCSVDLVGHTVVVDGADPRPLGRREAQLLRYLLDRAGQDVPREELLREVFGTRSRTTRALDMSVRRLRMLIERDPDAPDHLHTARGVGYRLDPPAGPTPPAPSFHLPVRLDRFVGRATERERLARSDARVTEVIGPPGVGKSRLALVHGREALDAYPGGVWWCGLGDARTGDDLRAVVSTTLGATLDPSTSAERWRSAGRALVVLDDADPVIDFVVGVVGPWLASAPRLHVLVTSRERLPTVAVDPPGAVATLELRPLGPPEALALFVDRAPGAAPDVDDPRVRRVVEQLDGLPLAIELAAARLRSLPPAELERRVAVDLLGVLQSARQGSDRHGSMRTAVAWSWDRLPGEARDALAQLSVFPGGFGLDAAGAVLGGPIDPVPTLVRRSLLEVDGPRFRLLAGVRAFATEQLRACAGSRDAEVRHGRWAARVAERGVRTELEQRREDLEVARARALARGDHGVADLTARALEALEVV